MIVRERPDHLVLVRQTDHAHLTGVFAEALSYAPDPRYAFERAARTHDQGWAEHDAAPTVDPASGRPHTYRTMPAGPYRNIWRTGIDAAYDDDPYAGLLVSLHGMQFFADKPGARDSEMYRRERERQDELLAQHDPDASWEDLPDEVRVHHELISFLDALSLFFCDEWASPWTVEVLGETIVTERRAVPADGDHDGGGGRRDHITVTPWPFGPAPIEFHVPAVRVPALQYADDLEFRAAIAEGDEIVLEAVIARGATHDPHV